MCTNMDEIFYWGFCFLHFFNICMKFNKYTNYSFSLLIMYGSSKCFGITLPSSGSVLSAFWEMLNWGAVDRILWMGVFSDVVRVHHVTRHNTPIHNIISTASQLRISQKALGTLPENVRSAHHVTRLNTPIHNILSTASQLSISQKAIETLPEDGNAMPKYEEATIYN